MDLAFIPFKRVGGTRFRDEEVKFADVGDTTMKAKQGGGPW